MVDLNYDNLIIDELDLRLLKGLITEERFAVDFVNNNIPELFLGDAFLLAKLICNYIKTYKNLPTIRILIDSTDSEELREKVQTLYTAFDEIEIVSNELQYEVDKIKKRYSNNRLENLADELRFSENIDSDKYLPKLEQTLKDIKLVQNKVKTYTQMSIKEYLPEFKQNYIARLKNPEKSRGIYTGYSYLDFVTDGINPGELLMVVGASGSGKSMLLNNLAIQVYLQKNTMHTDPSEYTQGYNILYFSLEMDFEACFKRSLSRLADVSSYHLRDSKLTKSEAENVSKAGNFIKKYPYEFEIIDLPRGVSIDLIEEKYLEVNSRFKVDAVFLDYIGICDDPNIKAEDWLKQNLITGKYHEFLRANRVAGFSAVQAVIINNNKKQDQQATIGLHSLARSKGIASHCSHIIQIETRENENLRSDLSAHLIKNRGGETGSFQLEKNFAKSSVKDIQYVVPDNNLTVAGFNINDDISDEMINILGLN